MIKITVFNLSLSFLTFREPDKVKHYLKYLTSKLFKMLLVQLPLEILDSNSLNYPQVIFLTIHLIFETSCARPQPKVTQGNEDLTKTFCNYTIFSCLDEISRK